MNTKSIFKSATYVTIQYADHNYKATVREFGQLSEYLSKEKRRFKIGDIEGFIPSWLVKELNMISHFALSDNVSAAI